MGSCADLVLRQVALKSFIFNLGGRMKKYLVGVTIYNSFEVKADSEEEAKSVVRDMDNDAILNDSDFNITYADDEEDV